LNVRHQRMFIDVGPFYSTSKNFLCPCEFKFDAKRLSLRALLRRNKDHRKMVPAICLKAAIGLANVCRGPRASLACAADCARAK
jgi:hypothetical protein